MQAGRVYKDGEASARFTLDELTFAEAVFEGAVNAEPDSLIAETARDMAAFMGDLARRAAEAASSTTPVVTENESRIRVVGLGRYLNDVAAEAMERNRVRVTPPPRRRIVRMSRILGSQKMAEARREAQEAAANALPRRRPHRPPVRLK